MDKVAHAEHEATGTQRLALAVARYALLLAYKDEYEWRGCIRTGNFSSAPARSRATPEAALPSGPACSARRGADGHLVKKAYGPGMLRVFRLLAHEACAARADPFGYTREAPRRARAGARDAERDPAQAQSAATCVPWPVPGRRSVAMAM